MSTELLKIIKFILFTLQTNKAINGIKIQISI